MKRFALTVLWVLSAAVAMQAGSPASASCKSDALFQALRTASGGASWDGVREIAAAGAIVDSGSTGTVQIVRDVRTGRSSFVESLGQGRIAYVYDGRTKWEQDQGFGVHRINAADSVARATTHAYLDRNGYWDRANDPASVQCLPPERAGTKIFDVVRITPKGGNPVAIRFDRSTHLLERLVEQLPAATATTIFSKYRKVAGIALPFHLEIDSSDSFGRPSSLIATFKTYRVRRTVAADEFARPPEPVNARMLGGARSTTVPISVEAGVATFRALVDGKGPFEFAFDPGAPGVLTTAAASQLGAKGAAPAVITNLRVGDAAIDQIPLAVYPGKPSDIFDRGPGKGPIAGALGPELLDRFAVRLDYRNTTMTLTPLHQFAYTGTGRAVPFTLQEDDDIPLIPASVDGFAGQFQVDVRAPSSVLLFAPFLNGTGLAKSYAPGGTIRALQVSGEVLHEVPARASSMTAGKFASRTEAGLFGSALLSRYVMTLDYAHQVIYFEALSPKS